MNKEALVENQLEESLIAHRFVHDGVRDQELAAMEISKDIMRMVSKANRRYRKSLEEKKQHRMTDRGKNMKESGEGERTEKAEAGTGSIKGGY